jgi:hypothetical protein
MDERREEERKNITLEVRWDGGSGRQAARISDLSMGGCYLDTFGEVEVGDIVGLEIKMPGGDWIALRGTVAFHQRGLGFSVCFTYLTEEEQEKLSQLIDS